MSRWVDFVKEFAKRRGITYGCALSDPDASQEYRYKYKEGKLSADQKKAIKPVPRPKMSDFYEVKEEMVEGESPMFEPKVKRRGRPKGAKNKPNYDEYGLPYDLPKTKGKGIIEDLAKRERGQISTKKIIADRVNEVLRKAEIRQKNQEDRDEGWRAVNAILPPPPRFTVEWRNTF